MYEKNVYEDGSASVSFNTSKYKVAMLNAHSTPQLELLGAILGLHLCQVVSKVLDDHVMKYSVIWCERMNVRYWIKSPSRKFKYFVANGICEIHTATEPTQRNFINRRTNPVDIGSRGIDIVALSASSTWWNGPEFLHGNKTDWPQLMFELTEKSNLEFKNTVKTCMVSLTCQTVLHKERRLDFNRFLNWKILLRAIG